MIRINSSCWKSPLCISRVDRNATFRDLHYYLLKARFCDVFKDPITDSVKTSKKGRLGLVHNCGIGSCSFKTVPENVANEKKANLLRPIFRNGELLVDESFATIRERAQLKEIEYVPQILDRY